jgi:organic radical activating enzyme
MGTQFDKELHNGATWRCDTIEVWMAGKMTDFHNILDQECMTALKRGAHIVVTGGEPLMHQKVLYDYLCWLKKIIPTLYVEIETNGTIVPDVEMLMLVNQWNVSPKLANSGNDKSIRINETALKIIQKQRNFQFKFVVSSEEDFDDILLDYPFIEKDGIWLMPAGENQDQINVTQPIVVEMAKRHGVRYTTRLHIEIWNKKTGV